MTTRDKLDSLLLNVIAEMRRQQIVYGKVLPVRKNKRKNREKIDLSRFFLLHNVKPPFGV